MGTGTLLVEKHSKKKTTESHASGLMRLKQLQDWPRKKVRKSPMEMKPHRCHLILLSVSGGRNGLPAEHVVVKKFLCSHSHQDAPLPRGLPRCKRLTLRGFERLFIHPRRWNGEWPVKCGQSKAPLCRRLSGIRRFSFLHHQDLLQQMYSLFLQMAFEKQSS